jgi:SAM-dependent methyltransferase
MQQQSFDNYAINYDEHFTHSMIGKAQRKQVHRHALNNAYFFQKFVLEVNCGTGEDAIWLAKQGAWVHATDISDKMLAIAKQKTLSTDIKLQRIAAQDIGKLSPEKYQSIFSNFGGLNCLSPQQLEQFKNGCVKLQGYEDQLVIVVMGRKCLWEKIFFTFIKKDKTKANRRLNTNGIDTLIDNSHFKTFYYSPKEIKNLFKKEYYHINTKPIGFFVPPSYMESYFTKRTFIFKTLRFMDWLLPFYFLSNYADHYIIIFEKK